MYSRAFSYNPTQAFISGATNIGTLSVAQNNLAIQSGLWWNGPDEDLGYVVCGPITAGNQSTPVGDIGTVTFWRSQFFTEQSFLSLINYISNGTITDLKQVTNWLITNSYWSSYILF